MRFSYAIVALIGAAQAMPAVGSLVTGRSVCNDASADCKSVARAVVADQAAIDARSKSRQAKARQANATAGAGGDDDDEEGAEGAGETNDKRSKSLFSVKTRDGNEARAVIADKAALDARQKSRQAKARQANATAGAGDDDDEEESAEGATGAEGAGETNDKRSKNLFETEARAVVADKAALDARQKSRQAKARQANATAPAGDDDDEEEAAEGASGAEGAGETNDKRSKNLFQAEAASLKTRDGREVRAVTDSAAMEDRMKSREAKSAAANDTADAGAESRKSRKFRKSRRSHQLW